MALAFCSTNVPTIVDVCGQLPYEWPCRAKENRLLIAMLKADFGLTKDGYKDLLPEA